jgi:hypothetical protein
MCGEGFKLNNYLIGMTNTTRKIRKNILQTFWTGNPIGRLERAALQSYVNQGYTVHIYTYLPLVQFKNNLPSRKHIKVYDARNILSEDKIFKYTGREKGKRIDAYTFLPFSDLFRFTMLHIKGGTWIDLDIFLLKPIPISIWNKDYVFSSERTIQKGAYKQKIPEIVDMGFIKVPGPSSQLTTWILSKIPETINLKSPFDFMNLYRKGIEENNLSKYIIPAKAFLPLNWWDVKESFQEDSADDSICYPSKYGVKEFCVDDLSSKDVYGIHWFRAILRKKGLPYDVLENRETTSSLYEILIQKIEDDANLERNVL